MGSLQDKMGKPPISGPDPADDRHLLLPAPQIKGYKILDCLGEGGFGMVYLAEQTQPVHRRVALKLIKPGMDSKAVVARFEAERQALALLEHANIAHVFDAGVTEAGQPYFAMEYIKGVPLTEHCDRQKLSIEHRLGLFQQVCEAVQYAHQKGIIHRDIKPSNILVSIEGDKAIPKIIDFGIAKAITQPLTERTLFTRQGQLIGTPEYMSPEQAEMTTQDIDTRSDIYSLGVLLYELLTGSLPFDRNMLQKAGFAEIQRIIREEEPPRPSAQLLDLGEKATKVAESRRTKVAVLAKRLHKELEWIPLKAMRKERTYRYRTAFELANDIQNYLNGKPLLAGPPSATYRIKKYMLKHRYSCVVVGLLVVIILNTSFISLYSYTQVRTALKELRARQKDNKLYQNWIKSHIIGGETSISDWLGDKEAFVWFLELWFKHSYDVASPEARAAHSYFSGLLAEYGEDSPEGLAAEFLLDPRPLAQKKVVFRKKVSTRLSSFLEFLIGEYHQSGLLGQTDYLMLLAQFGTKSETVKSRWILRSRHALDSSGDGININTLSSMDVANRENRAGAIEAYSECLEMSQDLPELDDWFVNRANRKLNELLNQNVPLICDPNINKSG